MAIYHSHVNQDSAPSDYDIAITLMANKDERDFDKYKEGKERILYIPISQGLNFDLSIEDKKLISFLSQIYEKLF